MTATQTSKDVRSEILVDPRAHGIAVDEEDWSTIRVGPTEHGGASVVHANARHSSDSASDTHIVDSGESPPRDVHRILLVEDNVDTRECLERVFSARGWRVETAANGACAWAAIQVAAPELVVTDVMMPGLDGFGLVKAIRADERLREIPVLLLTARDGEQARIEGALAGADDYIVKPFSVTELLARVEAQLLRTRNRALDTAQLRRLANIFEQVPVAIAILRVPDLVYELTNPSYRALMGGPDFTGTTPGAALAETDAQELQRIVDEVCRTRSSVAARAKLVRGTDPHGRHIDRYFDLVYQPMLDPRGNVHQVAAIGFEVTEVVLARRAAEDANRMKDEFLAMVSHELRSPLSPILTAVELLRHKRGVGHPELGIIERHATHVARLVDDLLDVARITQGKVELRLARVDIAHVLLAAVETMRPRLKERGQQLDLHCAGGLTVDADAQRLAQVVSNLLANASKYSDHGQSVELSAERGDRQIVVRVRDRGVGITSEMLPRVFDAFVQDRDVRHRSRGGLGLGLAIAKSIVEMHRGTIEVRSDGVGLGSEFAVCLPAAS